MGKRRKIPSGHFEATIDSLTHEGKGVARLDGKVTFIDGALAGERVVFEYTSVRRNRDEGRVVDVLTPSPDRVEPRCPHFGICGGCALQHLDHPAQVRIKQQVLVDDFHHLGNALAIPELLPPLTGPIWGYRQKARLGVKWVPKKGRVLVGFRERRSPYIAELERCEVLHPSVGERLLELSALIGGLDARERLPQIEVAIGDSRTALAFRHLDPLSEADRAALAAFGREHDLDIYLQPGGPDSVHPIDDGVTEPSYRLDAFDAGYTFRPTDFTQVNAEINRQMVARAIELLEPGPDANVLDLFCGLGNFTLPLARRARRVIGVEGEGALVARARENATRNGITNAEFHQADLTADFRSQPWAKEPFTHLLLDPPRSGAYEILPLAAALKPQRIVYVSCSPATLARDAAWLTGEGGYTLQCAGIMDMFPHTAHVESIALFTR